MKRILILGLTVLAFSSATLQHSHGQSVFKKIGDGWRKGKWLPGIPSVRPQTWQEVVFPICWGNPQNCRGASQARTANRQGPLYAVVFIVDCYDRRLQRVTGDVVGTYYSTISTDDARQKAWNTYNTNNICNMDPRWGKDPDVVEQNPHFDDDQTAALDAKAGANWALVKR
jgi:hypothetical protein